jgi:hypothetical protein
VARRILAAALAAAGDIMTIDDFSRDDGRSALGTEWRFFADTVMGGASRGASSREVLDGRACLRLTGNVSLENNGGFIQIALPLEVSGKAMDASGYVGVRLLVRGNGARYYVHLRTRSTWLPWQYYAASFETAGSWTVVDVPFASFSAESLKAPLDVTHLKRIAIVGAKRAFDADVAVARLEFYK